LEEVEKVRVRQADKLRLIKEQIASGKTLDFSGENLCGMDLSGLNLSRLVSVKGANLSFVDLEGTIFSKKLDVQQAKHAKRTDFDEATFRG